MQWYEQNNTNKKRLLREIAFINDFNKSSEIPCQYRFVTLKKYFVVEFLHKYQGKFFLIHCCYPIVYPKVRIIVIVFQYDGNNHFNVYESGFHNDGGVLCYLNHYPNQWDEDYGIEYIMKRVAEWFEEGQYDPNNVLPANYDINSELFIFPEGLETDIGCYGIFTYSQFGDISNVIQEVIIKDQTIKAVNVPKSLISINNPVGKGIMIYTNKKMISNPALNTNEKIKPFMNLFHHGRKGFFNFATKHHIPSPIPLVLVFMNQSYKGQAFLMDADKNETLIARFRSLRIYEDIFSRIKETDELDKLANKKIAIVGLGALGSTIATELTRSGIRKYLLIDNDKLEIENIGRHDLTLKDIDKLKTDAVKEKILDINPTAECISISANVIDDSSVPLLSLLDCDLVISTIDDQEAKYAIDSTLIAANKKVIFAGVFYNAVAGFILISEKKLSCFRCQSIQIDRMVELDEVPDFSRLIPPDFNYGCGLPTFPGGSIKTHMISLLTAQIAVNTLLNKREVDDRGYPYNFYLLGNEKITLKDSTFFNGFMDIKKYVLPGITGCDICDNPLELTLDEKNQYREVLEKTDQ